MNLPIPWLLLGFLSAAAALAVAPEFRIEQGAVRIPGVGPDNPIVYDNDWWFDVVDKDYLWAQASLRRANLKANVVTRDMWDWQKGYLYPMEQCWQDARRALQQARESGLRNLPDPLRGADRVLMRPDSGRIEDTVPCPSEGSRRIAELARQAKPDRPLLVICGGPLTTVANALLTHPDIADRLVVFNLTIANGGYNGKDAWSAWIVIRRTRYVDWGGGAFWDRDSVFQPADFDDLPDNPMTREMKRLMRSDLGRANQLGDGAPLVWLFQPACWSGAERRRATFRDGVVVFEPVLRGQPADLLIIPKPATRLEICRQEFFRVLREPSLFARPQGRP